MWQVLSSRKSFADPVIGSVTANRLGLHVVRVLLSQLCLSARRFVLFGFCNHPDIKIFRRDGLIVIENFLPPEEYQALKTRALSMMADADDKTPIKNYRESGFGKIHSYDWGFDRCDGGTLNRFYDIAPGIPELSEFLNNKRLRRLVRFAAGALFKSSRFQLYRLVQGNEKRASDSQRRIHRDTFHSAVKVWFSLSDVTSAHGPFHYAPGSQQLNYKRLLWEYRRSIDAAEDNLGGAFRTTEADVKEQYGKVPVPYELPENTLVIADVRGWHKRGLGEPGAERLAIYASYRPHPFGLPWVPSLKRKMPQK